MEKYILKDVYRDLLSIHSINPNVNLDINDYFVTLQAIEVDVENDGDSGSNNNSNHFNSRDKSYHKQKKKGRVLKPSEIVTSKVNRVLVIGSPGTGKTTLCKKLVHDFYNNNLWSEFGFTDVVWIRLRILKEERFDKSDVEFESNLERIIGRKLNLDGVLFILDGWDEIQDLMEKRDESLKAVQGFVNNLCQQQRGLILTSRPYAKLNFNSYDTVLELKGFSERDVRKYIKTYAEKINNELIIDEIDEYIDGSWLPDLVTIPILLDMFLYTFEGIKYTEPSEITLTNLYINLVLKLWLSYCDQIGRSTENADKQSLKSVLTTLVAEESTILCNLAEKWVKSGTFEFGLKDFKKSEMVKNSLKFAPFLNSVNGNTLDESRKKYEFIHLTLMEFYAALFILNSTNSEEFFNFVTENKYNPRFRVVLIFLAGLMQENLYIPNPESHLSVGKNANLYFDMLRQEPYEMLFSVYDQKLLYDCMNECRIDIHTAREIYDDIIASCDRVDWWQFSAVPLNFVEVALEHEYVELFVNKIVGGLPRFPDNIVDKIFNSNVSITSKLQLLFGQRTYSKYSLEIMARLYYDEGDKSFKTIFSEEEDKLMQKILGSESPNDKFLYGSLLRRYHHDLLKTMPIKLAKKYCELYINVSDSDSIRDITVKLRAGNANINPRDNLENNLIINRVDELSDEVRLLIEEDLKFCITDKKLKQIIRDIESFSSESSLISNFLGSYGLWPRWFIASLGPHTSVISEDVALSVILYLKRCKQFHYSTGHEIFDRLQSHFENIYSQCCPNLEISISNLRQKISVLNVDTEMTKELKNDIISEINGMENCSERTKKIHSELINRITSGQKIFDVVDRSIKSLRIPVNYIHEIFNTALLVQVIDEMLKINEIFICNSYLLSLRILILVIKCNIKTDGAVKLLKTLSKDKRLGQIAMYALVELKLDSLEEDSCLKIDVETQIQKELEINRRQIGDINFLEETAFPQSRIGDLLSLYCETLHDPPLNEAIRFLLNRQKMSTAQIELFAKLSEADYTMLLYQTHVKQARDLIAEHCHYVIPKDLLNSETTKIYEKTFHDFSEEIRSLIGTEVKSYKNYFVRSLSDFDGLKKYVFETYFKNHEAVIDWCKRCVKKGGFVPDECSISEETFRQRLNQFGYSDIGRFVLCKNQLGLIFSLFLIYGSKVDSTIKEIESNFKFHDISKEIVAEMSCNLDDETWGVFYYKALTNPNVSLPLLVESINSKNCIFMAFVLRTHFQRLPSDSPPIYFYKNRLFYNCSGNSETQSSELSRLDIVNISKTICFADNTDQACNIFNCNILNESTELLKLWCINKSINTLPNLDRELKKIMDLNEIQNNPLDSLNQIILKQLNSPDSIPKEKDMLLAVQLESLLNEMGISKLPLLTTVSELTIYPLHWDLSNNKLNDSDIKELISFLKDIIEKQGEIHILMLSENEITQNGFFDIVKLLPKVNLRHLNLRGNNIFLDEPRFQSTIGAMDSYLRQNKSLLSLDLSFNYISQVWIEELTNRAQVFEKCHKDGVASRYFLINKCKVIFERSSDNKFVPSLCKLESTENINDSHAFINRDQGSVAWTEKKRTGYFSWLRYSNHLILIFERIFNGQRQLITAELVKSRANICKILKTEVDLLSKCNVNSTQVPSLQNRLRKYHKPKVGYFPTKVINSILDKIDSSEANVGLRSYGLITNVAGPFVNCVDWAIDVMAPTLQYNITELRIPSTFRFGYYIWKHIDMITLGLSMIFLAVLLNNK